MMIYKMIFSTLLYAYLDMASFNIRGLITGTTTYNLTVWATHEFMSE